MATKKSTSQATSQSTSQEFFYTPVGNITVFEQVRSAIDIEKDSFKSLMQSIKDKGILEPLLVTGQDGGPYTLLCGERRLVAAQQLGFELVPVRVIDAGTNIEDIIAFQLTENLQREDLNPMDQANAILLYIQMKHPDKGYNVDDVMAELVRYEMKPDTLTKEIVDTVSTISQIVGKSSRTLLRWLSLINLPDYIRAAIADGTLPVSQGYLFAANLDCPDLEKIFQDIMKTPVTNPVLEKMFAAYKQPKPKPDPTKPKPPSLTQKVSSLKSWRTDLEKSTTTYMKSDLQKLRDELQTFLALIEQRMKAVS